MGKQSKKAQTTLDYFILTIVILLVITPLLFLSAERLTNTNTVTNPTCGNNQLDQEETCEQPTDCPTIKNYQATCQACKCTYTKKPTQHNPTPTPYNATNP